MDPFVFAAVIVGAACHAGWNTVVKLKLDPLSAISGLAIAAGVASIPLILAFGLPDPASYPYLAASVALHILYNASLSEAYRVGDLGQVYPIARGAAPVMTAMIGAIFLGESLGLHGWLGVLVITAGILLLSLRGGRALDTDNRAVIFALMTAVTITAPARPSTMPAVRLWYCTRAKPAVSIMALSSSWPGCMRIDSARYW